MEAVREKWTDERLDDMSNRMDKGFDRLDKDMREVRSEMNSRFEATHRLIIQVGGGLFGTMVIGFLSLVISFLLTQH
jgi:hypothetical protein